MANQFTKGVRKHQDESTKDKIRAEVLAQRLFKFAKSKGERVEKYRMDGAQVAAAKVLIERGKPALQAVEQRIVEEPRSEEQIQAQISALLPSLLQDKGFRAQVQAMLSGAPQEVTDEPVQPELHTAIAK